jgi:hypothetical protein
VVPVGTGFPKTGHEIMMSAMICSEIEMSHGDHSLAVDIDLHQGHANLKVSAIKWPCGGDTP